MIPGAFTYHRPGSAAEAVSLLVELGEDARVIAGGHSLIPMMKLRLAVPEHLVDLRAIDGLSGIAESESGLEIGAMTTQASIIASSLLAQRCPLLVEAAGQIADPQVRNCGTLGGNVANGDPGNDMPAVMQCLDASYVLLGPGGEREVPARSFYEGAFFTALQDGEILTRVRISPPPVGHGYAYEKQKRKVGDYATAAAAVVLTLSGGRCESAAIALTNLADTPLYAESSVAALVGTSLDEAAVAEARRRAEEITDPVSDGRGPAAYRTKLAGVMVARAVTRAAQKAGEA